jgi:uncharacterized protein
LEQSAVDKERRLQEILGRLDSVIVAFSGGVDSSYLAVVAHRTLGVRSLAVTGQSPSFPEHQRRLATEVVRQFGLAHLTVDTREIDNESYRVNRPDRCFHCKTELFEKLAAVGRARGFAALVDGANADDRADFRPGRLAAREHGVRSPLDEVDLTKEEVRFLSRRLGLPSADEPASACLASRIPYGSPVTIEKLSTVERGESRLRRLGFSQFRVRHHEELVRLEFAPAELPRALAPAMTGEILRAFKALGYVYVTVDLQGYRTGSLNEVLPNPTQPAPPFELPRVD